MSLPVPLPMPLVVLVVLVPMGTLASGLYFPQSDLTVRVPYLPRNDGKYSWRLKLLKLRTLRNDTTTDERRVNYRIAGHRFGEIATIEPDANILTLHGPPKRAALERSDYTVVVLAKDGTSGGRDAVLETKVRMVRVDGKEINCADYVQDMCFWNASRYSIYENRPTTMIGTFGPAVYSDICPNFRVTDYELLNGTEYFYAENDTLFANAHLDRDTLGPLPGGPGPRLTVRVRCIVWEEITGIQYAPTDDIRVDILDQDDNPPTAQGNASIAVTLRDFTAGDKLVDDNSLILKDADENGSNRYAIRILGDTHDALNATYDTLPIEASRGVPYTAIFTRISAKTTLLPKSPYRVILQVIDESLIPGYGEKRLNITLTFYGPEHRTTTTTVSPISTVGQRSIAYPSTAKVARIASRYTRVAKPSVEPDPAISFAVDGSDAFAITRRGGILYVADEHLLETEPTDLRLKVRWSGGGKDRAVFSKTVRIDLTTIAPAASNVPDSCNRTESNGGRQRSCANAETPEDCASSCGVASGSYSDGNFTDRCAWRWNGRSNRVSVMSDRYPTCSPDLTHCPDNRCDELERLDPRICPQDCTVEPDVHFAHMNKGGRGIKSGLGTCSCNDVLQCTCNVDRFRSPDENPRKGNDQRGEKVAKGRERDRENATLVSGARKASHGPCGPVCMVGAIGGSFFALVAIVGSLVASRYRLAAKEARREGKRRVDGDGNGLGVPPSDYVDRGDGLLIGLDILTAANRHPLLPKACPPDPKWEFPRARLTIERALGEGEFGRVLRARAVDIAGTSGPTTVAVKTLKENASASELTDLLSEYQLLKEVQHPNVIRLLGACTTPGAPVYLIIEFAEFGSLRNYLRRSRHLESGGGRAAGSSSSSSNVAEGSHGADAAAAYTVTPRDILSFAWQISKGMAYLADVKLVHRDLAARNVLLAAQKACKISDFGLTRDVYEDDAYLKRSKGRVPVKWMAPESLADHVYTSKSDVWSFGVLLWELITLGASPYPGVDVHNLYNLLKAGYRMERPANCSQQLYKLMISCWHREPAARPSFRELAGHWERMLEDNAEYLDLNPRTVDNRAYFVSLRAPDSPNGSGNDDPANDAVVDPSRTSCVNYLDKLSPGKITKCDKADKLRDLWRESVGSYPADTPIELSYANDLSVDFRVDRYESPIEFRSNSVASNSDNDQVTPPNEPRRSYLDMDGGRASETETEQLLHFNDATDKGNRGQTRLNDREANGTRARTGG